MNALLATCLFMLAQADDSGAEFYHDFRKPVAPRGLVILNSKNETFAKIEPEGLRFRVPKERKNLAPITGAKTTFSITGDFEATATFEILEAEQPASGFGVGISLFVQKAEPSPEGAGIYRLIKPGGKQVIYWDRSIGKQGEPLRFEGGVEPCPEKLGRMRLKRVGGTLHYLWAPGAEGEDFRQIQQVDFGIDDIKSVSMRGITSKQPINLDARFLELRIRSGQPIVPAREIVAAAPERARPFWWLVTVVAVVAIVAVGFAAQRLLRRRSEGPADKSATTADTREVHCPGCRKRLKVSAQAIGTKIKCPACAVAFIP